MRTDYENQINELEDEIIRLNRSTTSILHWLRNQNATSSPNGFTICIGWHENEDVYEYAEYSVEDLVEMYFKQTKPNNDG